MVAGSERSARARHKLLGKTLRGALWRVVGCGGRVEVRARAWGLSKGSSGPQKGSRLGLARAPNPTLTHERTCTMPRRHDRVALSTVWTLVSTLCEVNVAMDLVLRAPV